MANTKHQQTSKAASGSFDGNLNEDSQNYHKKPNQWTKARNAVTNTVVGDLGNLSNEASNKKATERAFLTIIGAIHIDGSNWIIFSTDDTVSEIGIFDEDEPNFLIAYTPLVTDDTNCLNFRITSLIIGVGRTAYDCGRRAYWDDGINPTRTMDIDNIPWKQDCDDPPCNQCEDILPLELDCNKLRLAPLMGDLSFDIQTGSSSGQLTNGSYYVAGAYLIEGQRVSDYSRPSNILGIFNHMQAGGSIDVEIKNTDKTFDEFELILIQFSNYQTVVKKVGIYSTDQSYISLDTIQTTWADVDPKLLFVNNRIADKSDGVFRAGPYMLRVGPTDKFDFNYQPLANKITAKWVSVEYPADYYKNGGTNVGYMRDEVYPFMIRWIYNTGDKTNSYHIPGRASTGNENDLMSLTGPDAITGDAMAGTNQVYRWQVYNSATYDGSDPLTNTSLPDGGLIRAVGKMGYWESSEKYPQHKAEIWDSGFTGASSHPDHQLCGSPIRHHKFPDNGIHEKAHHFNVTPLKATIRVMSVVFDNIERPVDNEGNPIENIVGYEILRGSREGNKTVLAKGMINNMRDYLLPHENPGANPDVRNQLYPNYPFNPTEMWGPPSLEGRMDRFLSATHTRYKGCDGSGICFNSNVNQYDAFINEATDNPLGTSANINDGQGNALGQYWAPGSGNVKLALLTFHSPDTNFRNPFLSAKELKVYGEIQGTMDGRFEVPKGHPRHKFITDMTFFIAAIIGIGYAFLSTEGEKKRQYKAPSVNWDKTFNQYSVLGTGLSSMGLPGPSIIQTLLQYAGVLVSKGVDTIIDMSLQNSFPSLILSLLGLDTTWLADAGKNITSTVTGMIGGAGGEDNYEHGQTPWTATPGSARILTGAPTFMSLWAEGVGIFLDIIYGFSNYRQFALQQISHGYYTAFKPSVPGKQRRLIVRENYLNGDIQDFGTKYRINNLNRSRTVALEIDTNLALPTLEDRSQVLYSDEHPRTDPSGVNHWDENQPVTKPFQRQIASHYTALKQRLHNQYGQLDGIIQVPVSTQATTPVDLDNIERSTVQFNGDTYIGRYTEKNTMPFFYDWLKDQPDGTDFDYKNHKNVLHPRFWMNTERFDLGEFISSLGSIFDNESAAGNISVGTGSFNMFAKTDPSSADGCSCDPSERSNCVNDNATIDAYCLKMKTLEQWQLYRDFIKDCAKFTNVNEPPQTNISGTYSDPIDDPDYDECDESITPGCEECPTIYTDGGAWVMPVVLPYLPNIDESAGTYLADNTGPYAEQMQHIENRVSAAQEALNETNQSSAVAAADAVDTGSAGNFWTNILGGIQTPSDHFSFDAGAGQSWRFVMKEAYMYLFVSGVRDFYVESEINVDYRDWGEQPSQRHYNHIEYSNLKEIFSTDHIKVGNYMKYDFSLSINKLFNNYASWSQFQHRNYDPAVAETCYVYRPKRVIYSLPQFLENQKDNWRVFLPFNYKDFTSVTRVIKPIGKNGALMLFENESPVQFQGVDSLETDGGTKITLGDGGLFSQPMQNLVNAEYPNEYGSCQNRLAVANTPLGMYYMSQNQGKIFQITGKGLREISSQGMKWWFANYLPYVLTLDISVFEDVAYEHLDNPVAGLGCQIVFDNKNQIVFFCKKDWKLKPEFVEGTSYLGDNKFLINGQLEVTLGDPVYFNDASWTVSWDPKINQGGGSWIGHHDWHPDLTLPSKKTYFTTKGSDIWKHADRCDNFCNFYGKDYPFEIEYTLSEVGQVVTMRNVMYLMEAYVYKSNCDDKFHVLDFNFDEAIIHNSEQCSGLLKLNLSPKNNAPEINTYPRINFQSIDILFSKEEQKYRFNQFWDITDDRGEFNPVAERSIFETEPNGYVKNLNEANLDYNKDPLQRKKFRHYKHSVILRRNTSGDKNIIVAMALQTGLVSSR